MLLMFQEELRGGICQSLIKYACANNKYMKNYIKKIFIIFNVFGRKQFVWMGND